MIKQIIVAALGLGMLSSCGIYSKYEEVKTVDQNIFGEISLDTTDTVSIADLTWKQFFTDPQLQQLIQRALENNVDIKTAQLRVQEAETALKTSKLSFLPGFYFSPNGSITKLFYEDYGNPSSQTYSFPITCEWQIDLFGSLRNQKRKNKAAFEQMNDVKQTVETQIIATTATLYYTLCMLDRQLEIAHQTESTWAKTVESARALKDAGLTNAAGVYQMEATYFQIQTTVLELEQSLNSTENQLSLLLAQTPKTESRSSLESFQVPENIKTGLPLKILSKRPDVRSAQRQLEAAFYDVNAARSAMYPNLTLSGSAGFTNNAGGMVFNPGKIFMSAAASLVQPLFANGGLRANLKVSKAEYEIASLNFSNTLLKAGVEVNDALDLCQKSQAKAELYSKQVESLQQAFDATSLLMEHGNTTCLEVLTARQSLLSAELSQAANKFQEISGLIQLYSALGGGSSQN